MNHTQFGEVVAQYEKLVYTICYQFTHNHHTAEDLAQETFIAAFRHIDSCPAQSLRPWLARIAANKAKDHLKSAYYRKVQPAGEEGLPEDSAALFTYAQQPEDITLSRETVAEIEEEIRALKEPYHQVAVLYFLQQVSVDEIARRLQRPPKTIHTQLYRAKRLLQQKMKGGP